MQSEEGMHMHVWAQPGQSQACFPWEAQAALLQMEGLRFLLQLCLPNWSNRFPGKENTP
jgi:hypothetical protein